MAFNGTGSLINGISGTDPSYEPQVGDGATELLWSDRHAGTIVEVGKRKGANGHYVIFQRDKATRTDNHGMSDSQSYSFEPDPDAHKSVYTKRKNGQWVADGSPMRGGSRIAIGYRSEHYDYSF